MALTSVVVSRLRIFRAVLLIFLASENVSNAGKRDGEGDIFKLKFMCFSSLRYLWDEEEVVLKFLLCNLRRVAVV